MDSNWTDARRPRANYLIRQRLLNSSFKEELKYTSETRSLGRQWQLHLLRWCEVPDMFTKERSRELVHKFRIIVASHDQASLEGKEMDRIWVQLLCRRPGAYCNTGAFRYQMKRRMLSFKVGNLPTESGLRDREPLCSTREVELFGQNDDRI